MAEDKGNLYGGIPKAGKETVFYPAPFCEKEKSSCYGSNGKEQLLGFTVLIPYKDMVMVDYLAVSSKIRSKGTGSYILQNVCREYADKKIVLLIKCLDNAAENRDQRAARRKFYLKNGFTSSDIFIEGASGKMEILNYGGKVSQEDYISLQKHALGTIFFKLSGIKIVKSKTV